MPPESKSQLQTHSQSPIPLSRLAHNLSRNLHTDLTALLKPAPSAPTSPAAGEAARREALLSHFVSARHRVARLLVATRWAQEHASVSARADAADAAADAIADAAEDAADALWDARIAARASARPATPAAAAVAGAAKKAAESAGLDAGTGPAGNAAGKPAGAHGGARGRGAALGEGTGTRKQPVSVYYEQKFGDGADGAVHQQQQPALSSGAGEYAAEVRLAAATRAAVRAALPHAPGLVATAWPTTPPDVAAAVGLPGAWTAWVALDSLNQSSALFKVHRVEIHVASDVDAPSGKRDDGAKAFGSGGGVLKDEEHRSMLMRLADDRLASAAAAVTSDVSFIHRNAIMLSALRDLFNYEICAPLAVDQLRTQAAALTAAPWSSSVKFQVVPSLTSPRGAAASPVASASPVAAASPRTPTARAAAAASKAAAATAAAASAILASTGPLELRYWTNSRHCATVRIAEARRPRHDPAAAAAAGGSQPGASQPMTTAAATAAAAAAAASSAAATATAAAAAATQNSTTVAGGSISNSLTGSSAGVVGKGASGPNVQKSAPSPQDPSQRAMQSLSPSPTLVHVDAALVLVSHDPPLPGVELDDSSHFQTPCGLDPSHLDLEALLLSAIRARSASRLSSIKDALDRQPPSLRVPREYVTIQSEDIRSKEVSTAPAQKGDVVSVTAAAEAAAMAAATAAHRAVESVQIMASNTGVAQSGPHMDSSVPVSDVDANQVAAGAAGERAAALQQRRSSQRVEMGSVAMCIRFLPDTSSGIQVTVSPASGGLRIRAYGSASLAASASRAGDLGLWTGDRHSQTAAEEEARIAATVKAVRSRVRLESAARSVCALDIGVSDTLPPGTASVAATAPACTASQLVPPCAPLERLSPKRFLTLSPAPPAKESRSGRGGAGPPNGVGVSPSPLTGVGSSGSGRPGTESNGLVTSLRPGQTGCYSGGAGGSGSGVGSTPSSSKRPRLAYATTNDALVFIQESSVAEAQAYWPPPSACKSPEGVSRPKVPLAKSPAVSAMEEADRTDRYDGTAAAAAAWAVTHDFVERRLRRDSLLRAFVAANVASAATSDSGRSKGKEDGDMDVEMATRTLLKLKCEPLPVRRAELLLRGNDAWQVRLSLLPPIFDSTNDILAGPREAYGESTGLGLGNERTRTGSVFGRKRRHPDSQAKQELSRREIMGDASGNLWSVGVACVGSTLTFTYPSANAAAVRSFFRDLTRARTAAALARGVPLSRFYSVLRRSPVRIVVGIGAHGKVARASSEHPTPKNDVGKAIAKDGADESTTSSYVATVEYVYSRGNSGGFSMTFSPPRQTMMQLAPLIEDALDSSGGQVGGILAGLLERACPLAAAADSAVRLKGNGCVRFVTALRVRADFPGPTVATEPLSSSNPASATAPVGAGTAGQGSVKHCVDMDARGGGGLVKVIDVGRAMAVMIQQGLASSSVSGGVGGGGSSRLPGDFAPLPKWDEIISALSRTGDAQMHRAGSTVIVKMEALETFLTDLVTSSKQQQA